MMSSNSDDLGFWKGERNRGMTCVVRDVWLVSWHCGLPVPCEVNHAGNLHSLVWLCMPIVCHPPRDSSREDSGAHPYPCFFLPGSLGRTTTSSQISINKQFVQKDGKL